MYMLIRIIMAERKMRITAISFIRRICINYTNKEEDCQYVCTVINKGFTTQVQDFAENPAKNNKKRGLRRLL